MVKVLKKTTSYHFYPWGDGEDMEKALEPPVVVGLGQVCVDYEGKVPAYPPEDTKAELKELRMSCGSPLLKPIPLSPAYIRDRFMRELKGLSPQEGVGNP